MKNLCTKEQAWYIFWVSTLTRLRYQVRPSCVLFPLRLLKFLETMIKESKGIDHYCDP